MTKELHAAIMNLPCKPYDGTDAYTHYCAGHRDARHAAAELALSAVPLVQPGEIVAWMAEDGERVVPASAKATADREGGASASAMRSYPVPLCRAVAAPVVAPPTEPEVTLFCAFGYADDGRLVALPDYASPTPQGAGDKIMQVARLEGFRGSLRERLLELRWKVLPLYAEPVSHLRAPPTLPQSEQPNTELPHLAQVSGEPSTARDAAGVDTVDGGQHERAGPGGADSLRVGRGYRCGGGALMPLDEDMKPCTVCGQPVLWGSRHHQCGARVLRLIAACEGELDGLAVSHETAERVLRHVDGMQGSPAPDVLAIIEARMREHERQANDPANPGAMRRRAQGRYGEAKAIYQAVQAAAGVKEDQRG